MKIYDEVTIDMNPESSNYGKHLSEDSSEWNGDVALCGSAKAAKITGDPRPGIAAMGRGQGMFPTTLDPGTGFIPGVTDPSAGTAIPWDSSLGAVSQSGYTGTHKGGFLGTGTRRHYDRAAEEAYSKGFGEKWYDPYMEVGVNKPMQQIRERGFVAATPEETGLSQSIISQLPMGQGDLSGTPVIEKSSAFGLRNLREDLDLATEEAETGRTEGLADIQIAEDEATRAKKQALQEGNIQRAQMARGTLAAEQQVRAPMGTSGFAYSGPQQSQIYQERGEGLSAFEDVGTSQRDIESTYQDDLAQFERGREDVESGYTEAKEGAERDYGREAGTALQSASEAVAELMRGATDIMGMHSQFGQNIQQGISDPGWKGFGKASKFVGAGGYGAPSGGWFGEGTTAASGATQEYLGEHFGAYEDLMGSGIDWLGTGEGDV